MCTTGQHQGRQPRGMSGHLHEQEPHEQHPQVRPYGHQPPGSGGGRQFQCEAADGEETRCHLHPACEVFKGAQMGVGRVTSRVVVAPQSSECPATPQHRSCCVRTQRKGGTPPHCLAGGGKPSTPPGRRGQAAPQHMWPPWGTPCMRLLRCHQAGNTPSDSAAVQHRPCLLRLGVPQGHARTLWGFTWQPHSMEATPLEPPSLWGA